MPRRLPDRSGASLYRPGIPTPQLSGRTLKWIAFVLTCLGSCSIAVLQRGILGMGADTSQEALAEAMKPGGDAMGWATWAVLCTLISTLAIPICAKLLCEGCRRTSDPVRYLLRLALCALVSEIPYDLAANGKAVDMSVQNPIWALLLAGIALVIVHRRSPRSAGGRAAFGALVSFAALAWAMLFRVHMGPLLVALAVLFYFAGEKKWIAMLGGVLLCLIQFPAPIGMLFVHWYSGERGEYPRWLFYALYPAQLLVFAGLGALAGG